MSGYQTDTSMIILKMITIFKKEGNKTSWAEQGHTQDFLFIRNSYEFSL